MGKCMSQVFFLNAHWSDSNATARGECFQCLTTLHAKRFPLLRVLPVRWSSRTVALLSGIVGHDQIICLTIFHILEARSLKL